ncbi:MAG: tetratricopeptide repeat-containing sensor histidine kinase [Fulvivirga sp.]|nr:tetratricopeptide repeat-containing sensor histidine kinase [Fulvivirga sp.]
MQSKIVVFIITCFFVCTVAAQDHSGESVAIDSLKDYVENARAGEKEQIDALNQLIDLLWHSNPQEAIEYTDEVYALVEEVDYPEGKAMALTNKGIAEYTLGNYKEAETYYISAIELANKIGLPIETYVYYINLLKKQGRYNDVIKVAKMKYADSLSLMEANPFYLLSIVDALIEVGDIKASQAHLNLINELQEPKKTREFKANLAYIVSKYYLLKSQYQKADSAITEASLIYADIQDMLGLAKAQIQQGRIKLLRGDLRETERLYDSALKIYTNKAYPFGVAEAKRELGSFYSSLSEFTPASELLFEALEIYEQQENTNEIAKTYRELAWIFLQQNSHETAEDFARQAVFLSIKVGNKAVEADAQNILGILFYEVGEYEKALTAHDKAYALRKAIGNKKGIASSIYNKGFVLEEMGDYDRAITLYLDAYAIEKEIENVLGIAISEYSLGSIYTKTGNYQAAERYLDKSRVTLKELNSRDNLLYNYLYSAELYEKLGRLPESIHYYKKYIALKDTLKNEAIQSQLAEMEVRYDLKNKEREIEILNLEKKTSEQELSLKEKTIRNQRFVIISAIVGAILLLGLIVVGFRLLRLRNRSNKALKRLNREIQDKSEEISVQAEELQEANERIQQMNENLEAKVADRTQELKRAYKELDTFFYRSSHDFRRPLTTFLGLAEVANSTLKDDYSLDLFNKVKSTALQLDKLVNKLKAMSLIGANNLNVEQVKINEVVDGILNKYDQIKKKEIDVKFKIEAPKLFKTQPDLLEIIIDNIIENSVLYQNDVDPYIIIEILPSPNGISIKIEDNGEGVAQEFAGKVFEMYFRANEKSYGNGLGLYLVKKAVDRLKGDINFKSAKNKGTILEIYLPETM